MKKSHLLKNFLSCAILLFMAFQGVCAQSDADSKVKEYDSVVEMQDGLQLVTKNKKYGILDSKGDQLFPCVYDFISEFDDKFTYVMKNGKYGAIDKFGNEVIHCNFEEVYKYVSGLLFRGEDDALYEIPGEGRDKEIYLMYAENVQQVIMNEEYKSIFRNLDKYDGADIENGDGEERLVLVHKRYHTKYTVDAADCCELMINMRSSVGLIVGGDSSEFKLDIPDDSLKSLLKEFILDNNARNGAPKHVIVIEHDIVTYYRDYIRLYKLVASVYDELRDEMAMKEYGKPFNELNKEQKANVKRCYEYRIFEGIAVYYDTAIDYIK